MVAMSTTAGRTAEGAFPKAAIPAGKPKTPAPTIFFTRLNTSCEMVAVPPDIDGGDDDEVDSDDDNDDEALSSEAASAVAPSDEDHVLVKSLNDDE